MHLNPNRHTYHHVRRHRLQRVEAAGRRQRQRKRPQEGSPQPLQDDIPPGSLQPLQDDDVDCQGGGRTPITAPLSACDYFVSHAPFNKIVRKALSRLVFQV